MRYGETTQEKCFYMLLNTFQSFKLIFTPKLNRLELNFSNSKKKKKRKITVLPKFFTGLVENL